MPCNFEEAFPLAEELRTSDSNLIVRHFGSKALIRLMYLFPADSPHYIE